MNQISQSAAQQMLEALIEATSIFDNYPETLELIGTYEVINNAIAIAQNDLYGKTLTPDQTFWQKCKSQGLN